MELPPPDELDGWRTHAWILVLPGPMGIEEPFFIEPAEGNAFPLDASQYQQIDSVYNHENYYVIIILLHFGDPKKNSDVVMPQIVKPISCTTKPVSIKV